MQRRVLNYLYNQGGINFICFFEQEADYDALKKMALANSASAPFIIFDFSLKNAGNYSAGELFERVFLPEDFERLKNESEIIFGGYSLPEISEKNFRIFYQNIELFKKINPFLWGILPSDDSRKISPYFFKIAKTLLICGENIDAAASFVEDTPEVQKAPLIWLLKSLPSKKIFPKTYKILQNGYAHSKEFQKINYKKEPEKFVKNLELVQKIEILKKNPLEGFFKFFSRFYFLFLFVVVVLPFILPIKIENEVTNFRDRRGELNRLSRAPAFEYTFDGSEYMERIARYAIGRFNAVITTPEMVKKYAEETLDENGYQFEKWRINELIYPPAGTVVKFSRPENLSRVAEDSIGSAWKYWTSIYSDSVAYFTEFYAEDASDNQRKHNGIDVAGRQGARILAPFAAKAWTSQDERGGILIGLVREKDVMIFMHCDQLLYLDGQDVMAGDPIATVGMTGHTTGPHAHIVTGLIDKNGEKRIGNVRYNVIDPIDWYFKFKPQPLLH